MARAAREAGVGRLVYLGGARARGRGAVPAPALARPRSPRSCSAPGCRPRCCAPPSCSGSGSASFEMLRYLTERLPVMVTPRWVHSRIQPIAVRDVLRYLVGCATLPAVGAPLLRRRRPRRHELRRDDAAVRRGRRPAPAPDPAGAALHAVAVQPLGRPDHAGARRASPGRWWSRCATPSSAASTTSPSTCPTRRRGCSASTRRSAWRCSGSRTPPSRPGGPRRRCPARRRTRCRPIPTGPAAASTSTSAPATTTAPPEARVAGGRGHRRGHRLVLLPAGLAGPRLAGPAVGGVGLRRGRRDPRRLYVGDALDFWRVEELEEGRLLRLRAEMRLPGLAWLEFHVEHDDADGRRHGRAAAAGDVRPARAGRAPVLVGHRGVPRHRLRRDDPRHRPRRRASTRPTASAVTRPGSAAGSWLTVDVSQDPDDQVT